MHFIYLPPYSPDLNTIEFGWKDLKRENRAIRGIGWKSLLVQKIRRMTIVDVVWGLRSTCRVVFCHLGV
ncbi:MAG: transposase [Methanosarcinales archaeon]